MWSVRFAALERGSCVLGLVLSADVQPPNDPRFRVNRPSPQPTRGVDTVAILI
jgi:hypothetical protein